MIPEYLTEALNDEHVTWIETKSEKPEKLKQERAIVHFITTPDLDRGREIVNPKGMNDTDFAKSPSVWYNHAWKYDNKALPVAKSMWRKKQEEGVLVKTQFASYEFAEDVYVLHEQEFMNTWSIGLAPVKDKSGEIEKDSIEFDDKKRIVTWNKWLLLEYSSAPIAMNPNARDMIKDLRAMNFKSFFTKQMIDSLGIEIEFREQIKSLQSDIEEVKQFQSLIKELTEKSDLHSDELLLHDKEILQLTDYIKELNNKTEQKTKKIISTELPVKQIDPNVIVQNVMKSLFANGGK